MSEQLTDNLLVWPTNITAPTDTDARNAASVRQGFQQLADRTAQLRLGARSIRRLANEAALQASTDHVTGDIVMLDSVGGVYAYDASSAASVLPNVIIKPNDVVNGRWKLLFLGLVNVANGFAQLDAAAKLAGTLGGNANGVATLDGAAKLTAAQRVGWVVDTGSVEITGTWNNIHQSTGVGTFVDVTGTTVTFTSKCNNGDVLIVNAAGHVRADASNVGEYQLVVVDGGVTDVLAQTIAQTASTTPEPYAPAARHILDNVGTGGTASVKLQFRRAAGGSGVHITFPLSITAQLIRP